MTCELAKQLKDAGFPQIHRPLLEPGKGFIEFHSDNDWAYVPTLSELIESCEDRFDNLEKRGATYFASGSSKDSVGMPISPFLGGGVTPEEAVANLWLELNKINASDSSQE